MDHLNPTREFFSSKIDPQIVQKGDTPPRELQRLVEYVEGLKAERRKIEAFKRELPLCLDLLNDAVERFEMEVRIGGGGVECNLGEVGGLSVKKGVEDMKNWMSSVQLWNYHDTDSHDHKSVSGNESVAKEVKEYEKKLNESSDDKPSLTKAVDVPTVELNHTCVESATLNNGNILLDELKIQKKIQRRCWSPQQACRKQRRCWSQELHRRFVDALQQLGGSEVATPKQIRDIMQVEGLTNDEVKSHLQKYRLHVRKPPSQSSVSPASNDPTASQDDHHLYKLFSTSHSVSPLGPLDVSAGSGKCSVSNNTTVIEEDGEETEGHSFPHLNRVIYRPTLHTY